MKITGVDAREVYDSRGFPTVEALVVLENGMVAAASVPSGASTGSHEARELRDGGSRLGGKGVTCAVANVRGALARAVIGMDVTLQRQIDEAICAADGTEALENMGANAALALSEACACAAARFLGVPLYKYLGGVHGGRLPIPMMNVINGGAHAANNIDIQEFMFVPVGAESFERAMRMGAEAYHALKAILKERGLSIAVGDEGGFAPDLPSDESALDVMTEAVYRAGMTPGTDIAFALDIAASGWLDGDEYKLTKRGTRFSRDALIGYYVGLKAKYPIISIEDPLHEDDFEGFHQVVSALKGVQIVGDDLFVTDRARIMRGAEMCSATAALIKPNQTGTVTRTIDAIRAAEDAGMSVIVSHRSGDTENPFIADLAAAVNARFIKSGAPARSERLAKYNRLLAIELGQI